MKVSQRTERSIPFPIASGSYLGLSSAAKANDEGPKVAADMIVPAREICFDSLDYKRLAGTDVMKDGPYECQQSAMRDDGSHERSGCARATLVPHTPNKLSAARRYTLTLLDLVLKECLLR